MADNSHPYVGGLNFPPTQVPASSIPADAGALLIYAPLASPALTGAPTAPTPTPGDSSTLLATTAFVAVSFETIAGAAATYETLADAATKAPLASPALTGAPTAPTPTLGDNSTKLATTAFVHTAVAGVSVPVTSVFGRVGAVVAAGGDYNVSMVTGAAPLAGPTFTGVPTAPTAGVNTNTTQLATTAFVLGQVGTATPLVDAGAGSVGTSLLYARQDHAHPTDTTRAALASPTFTGTPLAPTATPGTNTTQIATTAFVAASLVAGAFLPKAGGTMTGALTLAAITASLVIPGSFSSSAFIQASSSAVVNGIDIGCGTGGDIRQGAISTGGTIGGAAFQQFSNANTNFPGQMYFDCGNQASSAGFFRYGQPTAPTEICRYDNTGFKVTGGDLIMTYGLRYGANAQSFGAGLTLTKQSRAVTSAYLQVLTPTAGALAVTLPSMVAGDAGYCFKFWNASATNTYIVKNSGGTTIVTVGTSAGSGVIWDGTTWRVSAF